MGNSDRRPYLTATVLDQDFLDQCHDSLVNQLELIVDIEAPTLSRTWLAYTNPSANIVEVTISEHGLKTGETITISSASDAGLDGVQTITSVPGLGRLRFDKGSAVSPLGTLDLSAERTIHVSDRNKYVDGVYYEARLNFPVISRTVGEFLSAQLEFSSQELTLNNADGKYNKYLPAGDDFSGWIGNQITVKLGLRDVGSTYKIIFSGKITEEAGFKRSITDISFLARDDFDKINASFPSEIFAVSSYANIESDKENALIPIIYGDWTVNVEPNLASIPCTVVNGKDADMNGDTSRTNNTQVVISANDNTAFDTSEVYIRRGEKAWRVDAADISAVPAGKNNFQIAQNSNSMLAITVDTTDQVYAFESSDMVLVKVKGKDLSGYDDNIIEQSRDILATYTDASLGDFAANWDTFRDKTVSGGASIENAVGDFLSRIYINEAQSALTFILSLLEQVRLEVFLNRSQKLQILSNHLDDFEASPAYQIKNWDVEQKSFKLKLDERNNFNRAKGQFNFLPSRKENFQETRVQKNTLAITQAGREISKRVVFPNLYDNTTVKNQVGEILRLTSAYLENVNVNLTWRSLLLDIGDFVKLNVNIQGTLFTNVPCLIRQISYDPAGIKIPMRLWSFQMLPFPGYAPGHEGITGGTTATIVEE